MAGRPKYVPSKAHLKAIYELAKAGLTDKEISEEIGIAYRTFCTHKNKFIQELKKGREEGTPINVDRVESALLKKACGFEYEEITREPVYIHKDGYIAIEEGKQMQVTKVVRKMVVPSDTAIIYYLGNRAPDKWKSINNNTFEHELGPDAKEHFSKIADAIEKLDTNSD